VLPFFTTSTALGVILPLNPPAPPFFLSPTLAPAATPKLTSTRGKITVSSASFVASPTTVLVEKTAFIPFISESITPEKLFSAIYAASFFNKRITFRKSLLK
jgi:hypothetical protein